MFVIARYENTSKKLATFRGLDTDELFVTVKTVDSAKGDLVVYACLYSTFSLAVSKLLGYKVDFKSDFENAFVMPVEEATNFKNYFKPS